MAADALPGPSSPILAVFDFGDPTARFQISRWFSFCVINVFSEIFYFFFVSSLFMAACWSIFMIL